MPTVLWRNPPKIQQKLFVSLSASRCCLSTSASRCLTSVSCRVRHFNRRPHPQRARLPSLMLLKLPGSGSVGTCPRCRWGTAHCWIRPAARSASAGWPRCKWPRPPASPPSSARSWSSGTPSRTPGRGCSSRSNTGGKRQMLREHCRVTQYNFSFSFLLLTCVKINAVSGTSGRLDVRVCALIYSTQ